ncbi:MAG: GFA family protein [Polyangiales bacterium]
MRVDGQCHCGAIQFEADVDPETCGICHCTDCQALTGAAFRVIVRAPAATFVLRGTPTVYVKTADSGTQRAHAFCSVCGSPVYSCAIRDPETYSLRLGTLRQRAQLRPLRQAWCDSALPWAMNLEGIEKRARQ